MALMFGFVFVCVFFFLSVQSSYAIDLIGIHVILL